MENILSLIPQKPPFVMIDELLFSDEILTRCSFQVTKENIFTENNEFSEAGLMENIAQTAAAGAGNISQLKNEIPSLGYIGAVKNFEIFSLPKVNDKLITEIKILEKIFDVTVIEGKIFRHEELVASCEMKIFIANKMADQL
jgi:predicted hotdog family 3-hydroxylacyl-ACP dehydratase